MFKKTLFILVLSLFSLLAISSLSGQKVLADADTPASCSGRGGTWVLVDGGSCQQGSPTATTNSDLDIGSEDGNKILGHIQNGVNLLTVLAGLAITVSVIIGGIQYSTSGGNPNAAGAAKKRIGLAFVALLCLVFLYTFVQWLIPGGVFGPTPPTP